MVTPPDPYNRVMIFYFPTLAGGETWGAARQDLEVTKLIDISLFFHDQRKLRPILVFSYTLECKELAADTPSPRLKTFM